MKHLIDQLFQENPLLHFAFTQRMTAYEGVPVAEQAIYHNLETFLYMLKGGSHLPMRRMSTYPIRFL